MTPATIIIPANKHFLQYEEMLPMLTEEQLQEELSLTEQIACLVTRHCRLQERVPNPIEQVRIDEHIAVVEEWKRRRAV
jgi:hypothetical protein